MALFIQPNSLYVKNDEGNYLSSAILSATLPGETTGLITKLQTLIGQVATKQDAPSVAGTSGQVLSLDNNLNPVWVDQSGRVLSVNNKTGNVTLNAADVGAGTITQIKMNGASKGTTGVVDLGTVITAHQDISGKADKTATVSTVAYDTTNKKITKTINGSTSDVVTVSKLKTDMALTKADVNLSNVEDKSSATIRGELTSANVIAALGFTPPDATTVATTQYVDNAVANSSVTTVTDLTSTSITLTAAAETRYIYSQLDSLTISSLPSEGIVDIMFTSGTTPTVVVLPNTVKMPEWYAISANQTYEINILNGVYGSVMAWPT